MPANQEIWVFGDDLLTETKDWLRKLEFAYLGDNSKPQLYIHEFYNVKVYQTLGIESEKENFVSNIRNEIAKTVMRKVSLPQKILILISSCKLDDPVFAIECMEGLIRWLLDEIDDIIKFQKKCLPEKAKKIDSPRVYFLKVIPKPNEAPNSNLFKGVRRKFNNVLQTMLQNYHSFGFINVHEITTRVKDERFFISNQSGSLSDEGAIQLWVSISQTFKAIDQRLLPKAITKNQSTQWNPKDAQKTRPQDHEKRESSYRSHYKQSDYRNYDAYGNDNRYASTSYANAYYY